MAARQNKTEAQAGEEQTPQASPGEREKEIVPGSIVVRKEVSKAGPKVKVILSISGVGNAAGNDQEREQTVLPITNAEVREMSLEARPLDLLEKKEDPRRPHQTSITLPSSRAHTEQLPGALRAMQHQKRRPARIQPQLAGLATVLDPALDDAWEEDLGACGPWVLVTRGKCPGKWVSKSN